MWTSEEMVVTTTSITAVNESMRSAQSAFRSPKVMNENIGTRASWPPMPTSKKAYQDSTQVITKSVEVISSAARVPVALIGVRGVIVVGRRRIRTRKAIARADQRDGAGNDGAEQRQEDDGHVH